MDKNFENQYKFNIRVPLSGATLVKVKYWDPESSLYFSTEHREKNNIFPNQGPIRRVFEGEQIFTPDDFKEVGSVVNLNVTGAALSK